METAEHQYKPVLTQKRDRKYKAKYLLARKIAIGAICLFLMAMVLLAWTLNGNLSLQRLNDSALQYDK